MSLDDRLEEMVIAKIHSEGLTLDSPKQEIMDLMGRCVNAQRCLQAADHLLHEYYSWQDSPE